MIRLTRANPTANVHGDQGVVHASYPVSGTELSNASRMSGSEFLERALGQFLIADCSATTMIAHSHALAPRNDLTPGGGVPDFAVVVLPKLNFVFFSAGFNIWKEHISVSSTLIMAPALSNSPQ